MEWISSTESLIPYAEREEDVFAVTIDPDDGHIVIHKGQITSHRYRCLKNKKKEPNINRRIVGETKNYFDYEWFFIYCDPSCCGYGDLEIEAFIFESDIARDFSNRKESSSKP